MWLNINIQTFISTLIRQSDTAGLDICNFGKTKQSTELDFIHTLDKNWFQSIFLISSASFLFMLTAYISHESVMRRNTEYKRAHLLVVVHLLTNHFFLTLVLKMTQMLHKLLNYCFSFLSRNIHYSRLRKVNHPP